MSAAARPELEPGRAYRVRDLRRWGANPTRLASRLVREGKLRRAAHGLFYAPVPSRFGPAPPDESELLRVFLDDGPFILSGPPRWNALGLGATAMFAATLVYNTNRSGEFTFGGRLLPLKTRAECEARGLPRGQAERAVRWAEQALRVARRVVAELSP